MENKEKEEMKIIVAVQLFLYVQHGWMSGLLEQFVLKVDCFLWYFSSFTFGVREKNSWHYLFINQKFFSERQKIDE